MYTGQELLSSELRIGNWDLICWICLCRKWSLFRLAQGKPFRKTVSEDDRNMALHAQAFYQLICQQVFQQLIALDQPQQSHGGIWKRPWMQNLQGTKVYSSTTSDGSRFEKLGAHQISMARCNEKLFRILSEIRERSYFGIRVCFGCTCCVMCFKLLNFGDQ